MRTFHIVWTLALFACFVGIALWAWSGRRKHAFDEAARLPLEEELPGDERPNPSAERHHG